METTQLNKILLRGVVGNIIVNEFSGSKVAHITLATNFAYRSNDGCAVIETTWHSVTAWGRAEFPSLDSINKGDHLYVEGRVKQQRYTDANGNDRSAYEVLASKLEILTEPLQMEM